MSEYTKGRWMIGEVQTVDGRNGVIPIVQEGKSYIGTVRFSQNPNMNEEVAEANALRIVTCV